MKKLAWIALVASVLAAIGFFAYRWFNRMQQDPNATFIKPRLVMGGIQIKNMDKERIEADVSVLIDNPAPIGLKADSLSYRLFIGGTEVMRSTYAKSIKLAANDSSQITLPVTIANERLVKTLKSLEQRGVDSTDYTVKARLYADVPLLRNQPLDIEISRKLPLFRLPEAKIIDTDLDKLGLNQTKMTVKAEITNRNVFAFVLRDTRFRLTLNGEEFTEGAVPGVINIPARGKAVVELPVELQLRKAVAAGFRLLSKNKPNPYSFVLQTRLVDSGGGKTFQNSRIRLQNSGDLREIMREVKEARQEQKQERKEERKQERAERRSQN